MKRVLLIISVMLLVMCASITTYADKGGIPHHARTGGFEVGVGSELGSATFTPEPNGWVEDVYQDEVTGKWYTTYTYTVSAPIELVDPTNNNVIGYIDSLMMNVDQDPAVSLAFACRAGGAATTFTFTNFLDTSLVLPKAQATAGVTATDTMNNNGFITGLWPGGMTYQTRYNSGTLFENKAVGGAPGIGGTYSVNDVGSWQQLSVGVTRMEAQYKFQLSARDLASGTSNFQMIETAIVPEPSGILAAISCLLPAGFLLRRRR